MLLLLKQRSMLRYGWETRDRIIKPSEIYSKDKAEEIMERSKARFSSSSVFFSTIGAEEMDAALKRIEPCLKR